MDVETISVPAIVLQWGHWVTWHDLRVDARSERGVRVPNGIPGVYQAKHRDVEERLTIGKASDLRFRIKQGLVRGKTGHPAGDDIRLKEDTSTVVVRWAVTDRPSAVEEELHRRHLAKFGKLPKYTDHT